MQASQTNLTHIDNLALMFMTKIQVHIQARIPRALYFNSCIYCMYKLLGDVVREYAGNSSLCSWSFHSSKPAFFNTISGNGTSYTTCECCFPLYFHITPVKHITKIGYPCCKGPCLHSQPPKLETS